MGRRESESTRSLVEGSAAASTAAEELAPGTRVGRYAILERLGRGGMGEVYLAHDPELDRRLALKVLLAERRGGPYVALDRERLRREAQALARLSHPNVVAIYDVGEWDERTFIAMELIEGTHLGRWLRARPRTPPETLQVMIAAGRGLAAAHAAGIVHRDFKPSNVVVGRDGRVCVLDFGLATDLGRGFIDVPSPPPSQSQSQSSRAGHAPDAPVLTETGRTVGTPAYMAPEQHRGQPVDERGDQFAFCVSLFEAVVGQRPFPGSDPSTLLRAKEEHHLPPLPEPSPLPEWLRAVIDRGLAAAPERRYPSMDELLTALERGRRRSDGVRRRWWLVAAAGLGLVLAGGAWWGLQGEDPCERGAARVAEHWGGREQGAVQQAFARTKLGYAEPAFARVHEQLDDYAQAWADAHRSACEATRARDDDASEAGLDRRMHCLEQRLDRLDATVVLLQQADAETVRRATTIVASLPTVAGCALAGEDDPVAPEPPASPELARRVEELRRRLATVSVLEAAGRYADGLALARAVLDEARPLAYPPVQVETQRMVGSLAMAAGELAEAEAQLTEAALAAQALPYDEVGVAAMIDLVMLLGEHLGRTDEARGWAEHARAALARHPDPRAEARLWNTESVVDLARGDLEAARAHAERSLELRRKTLGDAHPELLASYNNLANVLRRLRRFDEAEQQYALALALAETAHGPDHPLVATLLMNLGGLRAEQGKLAEARPELERALDIRRRALGPRHPEVGAVLNNLGSLSWQLGEHVAARAMLRDALAIQEQALGPDDVKHVPSLNNLAEMLADERPEEARQHAERALELLDRVGSTDEPRRVAALALLGRLALAQGDLARARTRLEPALARLEPTHPLAERVQELREQLEAAEAKAAAASPAAP